jgi:hypothetical protein
MGALVTAPRRGAAWRKNSSGSGWRRTAVSIVKRAGDRRKTGKYRKTAQHQKGRKWQRFIMSERKTKKKCSVKMQCNWRVNNDGIWRNQWRKSI